jgi:hypothetical protein
VVLLFYTRYNSGNLFEALVDEHWEHNVERGCCESMVLNKEKTSA